MIGVWHHCFFTTRLPGARFLPCLNYNPRMPPWFFFFQAEDGIRDDLVTGVQTCALPILDGAYIEYANSFPVGDWRDEYRIRLASLTGLSAENVLFERAADHVWRVDLGRSQVQDVNGNLFNIDRKSVV